VAYLGEPFIEALMNEFSESQKFLFLVAPEPAIRASDGFAAAATLIKLHVPHRHHCLISALIRLCRGIFTQIIGFGTQALSSAQVVYPVSQMIRQPFVLNKSLIDVLAVMPLSFFRHTDVVLLDKACVDEPKVVTIPSYGHPVGVRGPRFLSCDRGHPFIKGRHRVLRHHTLVWWVCAACGNRRTELLRLLKDRDYGLLENGSVWLRSWCSSAANIGWEGELDDVPHTAGKRARNIEQL
jgi:hypothetical protein